MIYNVLRVSIEDWPVPVRQGVEPVRLPTMESDMTKKMYVAPAIESHGAMTAVTKGQSDGSVTDAVFPANTPRGQLTFS